MRSTRYLHHPLGGVTFLMTFLLVLLPVLVSWAQVKCPRESYIVRGVVIDGAGNPLSGVFVRVVLDDGTMGSEGVTSTDGRFEVRYSYDTSSDRLVLGVEQCGKVPAAARIVASKDGDWVLQRKYPMGDMGFSPDERVIVVPPIVAARGGVD